MQQCTRFRLGAWRLVWCRGVLVWNRSLVQEDSGGLVWNKSGARMLWWCRLADRLSHGTVPRPYLPPGSLLCNRWKYVQTQTQIQIQTQRNPNMLYIDGTMPRPSLPHTLPSIQQIEVWANTKWIEIQRNTNMVYIQTNTYKFIVNKYKYKDKYNMPICTYYVLLMMHVCMALGSALSSVTLSMQ